MNYTCLGGKKTTTISYFLGTIYLPIYLFTYLFIYLFVICPMQSSCIARACYSENTLFKHQGNWKLFLSLSFENHFRVCWFGAPGIQGLCFPFALGAGPSVPGVWFPGPGRPAFRCGCTFFGASVRAQPYCSRWSNRLGTFHCFLACVRSWLWGSWASSLEIRPEYERIFRSYSWRCSLSA